MKRWIQEIYCEYQAGSFHEQEGFLEWFLKRKLGYWSKIGCAALLWGFFLFLLAHLRMFIYLFYGVIALSVLVMLAEID